MRKGTSGDVGRTVVERSPTLKLKLSLSHIPTDIVCDESDCVVLHWFPASCKTIDRF